MVVKKKSSGKLMEGMLMGAALGVAAGVLARSKFGKKMTKDIKDKSVEFYKHLAPYLGEAQAMLKTKQPAVKGKKK